jgi:AraC family transcriptional regulator
MVETKPGIEILSEKKLVGSRMKMTFSDNRTVELWKSFMPRRKEIQNSLSTDLFSVQVYSREHDFKEFNIHAPFEKWAAVEVSNFGTLPEGMEPLVLQSGLYAVFLHRGGPDKGPETFSYIFGTWLPDSEYLLDDRPHFEILGARYKNNDPDSEEEIWIPVKPKQES